jgi:1-acyl-sn-glycerol-3-phosphate acyltransferase
MLPIPARASSFPLSTWLPLDTHHPVCGRSRTSTQAGARSWSAHLVGGLQISSHAHIVDFPEMERINPVANPVTWWMTAKLLWLMQNVYGGVRVEIEGSPQLEEPVIFAMNHTHLYDFMQSRLALFKQCGIKTSTFVKPRAFQKRLEGTYIKTMGMIPLASRGYLISADFAQLHGRTLDEEEYRLLRDHIDNGTPLPSSPLYEALQTQAREMLGVPFDPKEMSYGEALGVCYSRAMAMAASLSRKVIDVGHSLHIYPEGLYSTRLSRGRTGTVKFAAALDIPILPVGFSGMNEHFARRHMVPHSRGSLIMRFGTPFRIQRAELQDYSLLEPQDDARLQPVLEEETNSLMEKINGLLEPQCTWGENLTGDGLKGIARFFE